MQSPPPPGLGRDPSSRSFAGLLATASSSCPSSLGRAPPNPHGPTAAAAAAAAWAVTVSGSLGPAGSAPPHSAAPPHSRPRPLAQAPPPPGRRAFFAAGSAPFPTLPHSAGRQRPCLGVCPCLGPAARSAGRPFCGRPWGPSFLRVGGVGGGGGCVLASPSSREWLLPPTPSPLGREPSFVFQAERTRWLLGPYPLVGGQLSRETYPLPLS